MEAEDSTPTNVFNPELRGLMGRLRLSRNSNFAGINEDFVESPGEIGIGSVCFTIGEFFFRCYPNLDIGAEELGVESKKKPPLLPSEDV